MITWEQLQDAKHKVEDLKTWDACVLLAKQCAIVNKNNRITIATIAMKACKIKHGGKSVKHEDGTLKKFAQEVGVHHKTLSDWVRTKRVIDRLPKDEKQIDWQAARLASDSKKGGDSVALYRRYSSSNPGERNAAQSVRYLAAATSYFTTHGVKYLKGSEMELSKGLVVKLNELLKITQPEGNS